MENKVALVTGVSSGIGRRSSNYWQMNPFGGEK
jgi:NADP-dependent 3-hydroxy acid dehydrogenase YdfG